MGVGEQERAQRSPIRVVLLGVLPQAEEDLLGDLFGQRLVAQDSPGEALHGPGVAPVGLGESLLLKASNGRHERRIAHAGEFLGTHSHSFSSLQEIF